jgi:endonuclease YncB( thermonuclease family)
MMRSMVFAIAGSAMLFSAAAFSADLVVGDYGVISDPASQPSYPVYKGRVAVIDGRTLWFPEHAVKVQLMDLDTCDLPRWSFDKQTRRPVPCGGFAKAWLKRFVGSARIDCFVAAVAPDGTSLAYCYRGAHDVGLQLIAKGWARVATPDAQCPRYLQYQEVAARANYGMWKDHFLDMREWRTHTGDKTLTRRPIVDYRLLRRR